MLSSIILNRVFLNVDHSASVSSPGVYMDDMFSDSYVVFLFISSQFSFTIYKCNVCLRAFFVMHFGLMSESVTIILWSEMAGVLIELKTSDGVVVNTTGYFGFSWICVRL